MLFHQDRNILLEHIGVKKVFDRTISKQFSIKMGCSAVNMWERGRRVYFSARFTMSCVYSA